MLTPGMRIAQRGLARFLPLIDWLTFDRQNVSGSVLLTDAGDAPIREPKVARFCCASGDQAILYLIRRDNLSPDGRLDPAAPPLTVRAHLPLLQAATRRVTAWHTAHGEPIASWVQPLGRADGIALPPLTTDMAVAVGTAAWPTAGR
jgi:mannan endo-1,4-beta-mannosidase